LPSSPSSPSPSCSASLLDQLSPDRLGRAAAEEIASLLPMLRRLPRRLDRILAGGQQGHPALAVHPFADHPDGTWFVRRLHDVLLPALAGVVGLMRAILTGLGGGPAVRGGVGLHALIGYNLLVVSGVLGVRVLAQVFRQAR
jgi:ubiquinone biosynthesis protein